MIRVVEVLVVYGLVGLGCAAAAAWQGTRRALELGVLIVFWPLFGPFTFTRRGDAEVRAPVPPEDDGAAEFIEALRGLKGTGLEALLPDPEEARALATRLRETRLKVREIEALLARDEFSDGRAEARALELSARGEGLAAEAARGRVQLLRRLRALRARWVDELEAVGELIAQFRVQTEVARLAGDHGEGAALIDALVDRVAGLGAVLEEEGFFGT